MQDLKLTNAVRAQAVKDAYEEPAYHVGQRVAVGVRYPIGHYRVPRYIRGKRGTVEAIMRRGVNNEEEGFGRNAGAKRFYYRIAIPMSELWPDYVGAQGDGLRIEVFETWLEEIES